MVYFNLSFEYVLFSCFCVSLPLYLFVLVNLALAQKTDAVLRSPFFRIVISTGVADVLTALHTYFYIKFRLWGWAFDFHSTIHPVFKYELLIGYATTFAPSIGTLLIGVNRFTAMIIPIRHLDIWAPKRVRWYIVAQWAISFILVAPGAFFEHCDLNFNKVPENGIAIVNGINFTGLVTMPVFITRSTDLSKKTGAVYQFLIVIIWVVSATVTLAIYLTLFYALPGFSELAPMGLVNVASRIPSASLRNHFGFDSGNDGNHGNADHLGRVQHVVPPTSNSCGCRQL